VYKIFTFSVVKNGSIVEETAVSERVIFTSGEISFIQYVDFDSANVVLRNDVNFCYIYFFREIKEVPLT
jgi:hypothetical protein